MNKFIYTPENIRGIDHYQNRAAKTVGHSAWSGRFLAAGFRRGSRCCSDRVVFFVVIIPLPRELRCSTEGGAAKIMPGVIKRGIAPATSVAFIPVDPAGANGLARA